MRSVDDLNRNAFIGNDVHAKTLVRAGIEMAHDAPVLEDPRGRGDGGCLLLTGHAPGSVPVRKTGPWPPTTPRPEKISTIAQVV